MGSSWPYMKTALEPLFKELTSKIPGFNKLLGANPDSEKVAKNAAEMLAVDNRLHIVIIDGFANLQSGQREIYNRLVEIQTALDRQNAKIDDLHTLSEKQFNKIIELLEKQETYHKPTNHTSDFTMYDLEGSYTLVYVYPEIDTSVHGCSWKVGLFGMDIKADNAFVGHATCSLPFVPSSLGVDMLKEEHPQSYYALLKRGITKSCIELHGKVPVYLFGTVLKIETYKELYLLKEVRLTKKGFLLTWETNEGKHSWDFQKNDNP